MPLNNEETGTISLAEPVSLAKPVSGVDNVSEETDIPEGFLREAVNVNLNKHGDVIRRKGYSRVYTGTNIHSLYKNYFVENGSLKYLNADYTATVKFTGLDPKRELSYCYNNLDLILTNGLNNYREDGSDFGNQEPTGQPILSADIGQLSAGIYQVAICFIDMGTFEMSGTVASTSITVTDNSGIRLINIAQSPDNHSCAVYVSNTNGDTLYRQTIIDNGVTTYTVSSLIKNGRVLDTQHLTRLPAGQIIRSHKDRVYVADSNTLWFSESMRTGLCRLAKNFFSFPESIAVLEPVEDGIYVIADSTYFLTGIDVNKMSIKNVSPDKAIEGTGLSVKSSYFNIDSDYDLAYWFSNKGAMLGMPGGRVKNLTESKLSVDVGDKGISDYRELAGIRQVVSRLNKKSSAGSFGASDYATGDIIRNGVLIN